MKINNRLNNISEYHFKAIEDMKQKLIAEGKHIYDLSIGDPDLPVDENIISELINSLNYKDFNKYPPYDGVCELKKEIIKYYDEILSVKLEMDEVIILIGSKEGISNLIPSVCSFNDYVIVPRPGYSVYETACYLWGAIPYNLYLTEKDNYLPVINKIPENIINKTKLFIMNYPNNPTGANADKQFYRETIDFCNKKNIVLCNDASYMEIIKPEGTPLSILKDNNHNNCIEFGTFSKTFCMTGFRIGYAVGDREIIKSLLKVKSNSDSGQFKPIQYAAVAALKGDRQNIIERRKKYSERKALAYKILSQKGIDFFKTQSTFYVWCTVPSDYSVDEYCKYLVKEKGVIVTPGYIFGNNCYNYFRISLTTDINMINTALNLI